MELQEGEFVVKYLRNSGNTFVFPDISVSVQNVVEVLPSPMIDNRGHHFFLLPRLHSSVLEN